VTLEVSRFEDFSLLAALPAVLPLANDNTAKADVGGLMPDTLYFYRFKQGLATSRMGRVRTAPLPATAKSFSFGWSGDSNAFFKPYTVLEGMTHDDPDVFMYIGDTIYSDDPRSGTGVATTIADYWNKYKENRDDHALRDLMGRVGSVTMWDDHEVTNDFYGSPFGAFGPQIIAGNQAFRDYMPIRENTGDPMQLYRSVRWGSLAEFFLIDCRQYRSPQADVTEPACLDGMGNPVVLPGPACQAEINDPSRVYLGTAQTAWLKNALQTSTATWKFVMNGPLLSALQFQPYDRWEGYGAARADMLEFINANAIPNVIFLSTDIHAAIVNDGIVNPGPSGGSVREIVAGAIGMDPIFRELPPSILGLVGSLPGIFPTISYFDIDRRNYVLADVTPTQAVFTYRDNAGTVLKTVTVPAN
jgi:alkaline phosphatase D